MEPDKKKIFLITGILVGLVVVGALVYKFVLKKEDSEPISPASQISAPQVLEPQLTVWEDPAGFTFSYPENLEVDPHEEDDENYAHVELTALDQDGGIIVWMKDTAYSTADLWLENEEEIVDEQAFDTTLGDHDGKKVMFANGKLLTMALDGEVVVLVEMSVGDNRFWQPIYDQIIQSFEFVPLETEAPQAPAKSAGSGVSGGGAGEIWE